jgi:hypothetical protein
VKAASDNWVTERVLPVIERKREEVKESLLGVEQKAGSSKRVISRAWL